MRLKYDHVALLVLFCALVVVLIVIIRWLTATHEVRGVVIARSWSRSIDVGQSNWTDHTENYLPSGARNVSSWTAIVGYRSEEYESGESCVKSGTTTTCSPTFSTRMVPIYGTRYSFQTLDWHTEHTDRAVGEDATPHWPVPRIGDGQRAGERHQEYHLLVRAQDKTYTLDLDQPTWTTRPIGSTACLSVNRLDQPSLELSTACS